MKKEYQIGITKLTPVKLDASLTLFHKAGMVSHMEKRPNFGFSIAISGKIVYCQNERELVSEPGKIIFYTAGAGYDWHCLEEGQFTLINFTCLPGDELPFQGELLSFEVSDIDYYLKIHRAVEKLAQSDGQTARFETFSLLYRFLSRAFSEMVGDESYSLCRSAADYMGAHFSDSSLSISEIASIFGISEPYFRSLFRSQTGTPPGQYLQQIRLRSAERLLTGTDYSVEKIATLCGYSSLAHFSRLFREKFGLPPSDFRHSLPLL